MNEGWWEVRKRRRLRIQRPTLPRLEPRFVAVVAAAVAADDGGGGVDGVVVAGVVAAGGDD